MSNHVSPKVSNAKDIKKVVEAMYLLGEQSQFVTVIEAKGEYNHPNAYRLAAYLKDTLKINSTVIADGLRIHLPYTKLHGNYDPYNSGRMVY